MPRCFTVALASSRGVYYARSTAKKLKLDCELVELRDRLRSVIRVLKTFDPIERDAYPIAAARRDREFVGGNL